jgi:uncharacterized membrane protein YjdF/nucleoside-diphosphate-sugar epimerase
VRERWAVSGFYAFYVIFAIVFSIDPPAAREWFLDNLVTFVFLGLLLGTRKWFRFSDVSYVLMTTLLCLHAIGSFYVYDSVPAGFVLRDWIGTERNAFDRIVHFAWGLLFAYPVRELAARTGGIRGAWLWWIPIEFALAFGAVYEIVESVAAQLVEPAMGAAFLGAQGDPWDAQMDIAAEMLGAIVASLIIWAALRMRKPRKVLITGASGVLGTALLRELDPATAICLVHRRAPNGWSGETITGDVTQERFGLSPREYRKLASRIDCIVHAAASTNFGDTDQLLLDLNAGGTKNAIALARAAGARLVYVSTAFVNASRSVAGTNGYENSKRAAEALVRASGVPFVIVRPSIISGDSETGEISEPQGLHLLMRLVLENRLPLLAAPKQNFVDLVPQDVAARAIAGIVRAGIREGEFDLTCGADAPSVQQLVRTACDYASRELNVSIIPPRVVAPDTFERLIAPVFLHVLPRRTQAELRRLVAIAPYLSVDTPLRTSLPELGAMLGIDLSYSAERAFTNSLAYFGAAYRKQEVA